MESLLASNWFIVPTMDATILSKATGSVDYSLKGTSTPWQVSI